MVCAGYAIILHLGAAGVWAGVAARLAERRGDDFVQIRAGKVLAGLECGASSGGWVRRRRWQRARAPARAGMAGVGQSVVLGWARPGGGRALAAELGRGCGGIGVAPGGKMVGFGSVVRW